MFVLFGFFVNLFCENCVGDEVADDADDADDEDDAVDEFIFVAQDVEFV